MHASTASRVLGRIRLSRATEESTSAERQREIIERWADEHGHRIVGWAEDIDVSGSVDPFHAPELGPWLAQDRLGEWDIICAWKLDRLARRSIPLHRLFGLCQDNNKQLVCVSDSIDLSTWVGRLVASVIAGVAEGELEAIRERAQGSQKKLREVGRWGGGIVFYGFKPSRNSAGWEWVHDPYPKQVLLGIIEKVIAGQSTESIAAELNDRGELPPSDYRRKIAGKQIRGTKWSNNGVRDLLRSKSLLGHMTHKGVTVRGPEGHPVMKGEPLVSRDRFDQLQSVLAGSATKIGNRSRSASPLLQVAVCGLCGRWLHLRQHRTRGKLYRYYRCAGGAAGGGGGSSPDHPLMVVNAGELEELLEEAFLVDFGARNVTERVFRPAEDHQTELDEAVRAVEEISTSLRAMRSETVRKQLTEQLRALDSRVAHLETLPKQDARWDYQETGQTYGEVWKTADTEARRQLLLKRGVTAAVTVTGKTRTTPGALQFELRVPD